jgi:glucose-6-phosphate dehydrogenase assembly protein OpcA
MGAAERRRPAASRRSFLAAALSNAAGLERWLGEDVTLAEVGRAVARLRADSAVEGMRTSVMTHIAWVPEPWLDKAHAALAGMGERHPSRTIVLVPDSDAGTNRIDATASLERYAIPGVEQNICTEGVELRLLGTRAKAPASIVEPLLISDLPVFLRWRGEPPWGTPELEQLVDLTDRLIVDSTEWDDVPYPYRHLVQLFERTAVSDIAWARTSRWRMLLASLWPGIADVRTIRVRGTAAQAQLLAGWLRSRLERDDIALEHVEAERLEAVELDGESAAFPPGDPPLPSDVLSDELDRFIRDRVYEDAVRATIV